MHVIIGLLSYTYQPDLRTALSLAETLRELSMAGIKAEIHTRASDGILPRVRNSLISSFWKEKEATDLVLIDDDVAWKSPDFFRLLSHPVDIVGATYRFKRDDKEGFPLNWDHDQIEYDGENPRLRTTPTGLLKVLDLPTGFLRITRRCVEDMISAYGARSYWDTIAEAPAWALFDFDHVFERDPSPSRPGGYRGEDYVFCRRYRDIGGSVYLDPELRIDHIGKKVFPGCVADWLGGRQDKEPDVLTDEEKAGIGNLPPEVIEKLANHPAWKTALGEA